MIVVLLGAQGPEVLRTKVSVVQIKIETALYSYS